MNVETGRMTLTDFLLARIDEDESVARQAEVDLGRFDRENVSNGGAYTGTQGAIVLLAMRDGNAMDPARVLAECSVKRRIVRDYVHAGDCAELEAEADRMSEAYDQWALEAALEIALRALASVYADHPDYDQTWRP